MTKKVKVEENPHADLNGNPRHLVSTDPNNAVATNEWNNISRQPTCKPIEELQLQIQQTYLACFESVHTIKAMNAAKPTDVDPEPLVHTAEDVLDYLVVEAVARLAHCGYGITPSPNAIEDSLSSVQQMARAMALEFFCERSADINAAWAGWKGAGAHAILDEHTHFEIRNDCDAGWEPYKASLLDGELNLLNHPMDKLQLPQMEVVVRYVYEQCHEALRTGDPEPAKLIAALAVRHLERIGHHRGLVLRALTFEVIDAPAFAIRKAWDFAERAGAEEAVKREIKTDIKMEDGAC